MSLLDIVAEPGVEVEAAATEDTSPASTEAKWWLDDALPGAGDRPEWLPEKYKTVKDLANSYKELEKKLGAVPDEYDTSKGASWFEEDFVPFKELKNYAKEKRVPQDFMDAVFESVDAYLGEFKPDIEEEMAELGENAKERLRVLNTWAKQNLSDSSFATLSAHMQTADAILALEEIRAKMLGEQTMIPNGNDSAMSSGYTLDDYRSELQLNLQKYKDDPKFRKEMQTKLERINL